MISGLAQGIDYMGFLSYITTEGMERIQPQFKVASLQVYLDNSRSAESRVSEIIAGKIKASASALAKYLYLYGQVNTST